MKVESQRGRMPVAGWVVAGVLVAHGLFFWWAADKHFLPKARYVPPPPTPNFAARRSVSIDPATGETTTHSDFVVSTTLVTPGPAARPTASPAGR